MTLKGTPKLSISKYGLRYRSKKHARLPHVVKFSGGSSSGMMLCILLENKILDPKRGDVIVFNNTAAEHSATYEFVVKCKRLAEEQYGIPFFWIEYQTYEDVTKGQWMRLPSYRLAKPTPWSKSNPDGYHDRGEPFEEMLSLSGYVPNQFSRSCTKALKLEITRKFLHDWFACKPCIPRLGHWYAKSRIDDTSLFNLHRRNRGETPPKIYLEKKRYVRSRPTFRAEQHFADFTKAPVAIDNPLLEGNSYGGNAHLGPGSVEYVAFIGLRADEEPRVRRVEMRAAGGKASKGYEGEHVYMPLFNMGIGSEDIQKFWKQQGWGLSIPSHLSNCMYCFLKGSRNLQNVHKDMQNSGRESPDTPQDVRWWQRIEQQYGRDLELEDRKRANDEVRFIGFFGKESLTYADIAEKGEDAFTVDNNILPCECTD
ncbi:MAG: hypothetical protein M2R45_00096 [Verrucomicrobia subdivision 3 bacterium]|nr:hypothetical protein [Limisphaerales bacterium]MCS1412445.1 hypothetical protein [Limisphaerales bacterium]